MTEYNYKEIKRQYKVAKSPWGKDDEIGRLNWITTESTAAILDRIDSKKLYDLTVDYTMNMPSWQSFGDPSYQIWMTHTPSGTCADNLSQKTKEINKRIGYSGDSVSFYTHTGTHIDSLNHFGYNGEIWNGFNEKEDLGSRHWTKCGIEKFPFLVARGVLIDVAGYKGVDILPDSYAITPEDLEGTLAKQKVELKQGDIILLRTGRMTIWPDPRVGANAPGINIASAEYLAAHGAMVLAADTVSLEHHPSAEKDNWNPCHCFLLSEVGIPIAELLWLEDLAKDKVYEGGFIASVMPLTGATAAPFQPVFSPFKK